MESQGQVLSASEVTGTINLSGGYQIELFDQIVTGDGPYYVASTEVTQADNEGINFEGIPLFTIVERKGVWMIQLHQHAGRL